MEIEDRAFECIQRFKDAEILLETYGKEKGVIFFNRTENTKRKFVKGPRVRVVRCTWLT